MQTLLPIIQQMDSLRAELEALRPLPDDRAARLSQLLRIDWNFHSNSIEGNTLSASETRAFLLHGITAAGKPFRDYLEMRGHNEALKKIENLVNQDIVITERLIRELHQMILVEPWQDSEAEINPGEYKRRPNYLYSVQGERIDFTPPERVATEMNALVNWLNNHLSPPKRKRKQYDLHPLLIATAFHLQFIHIHPFGDGNGRMARLLMNLILMQCGYAPAIIRQEQRRSYFLALNQSTLAAPAPLATLIGESCIASLQLSLRVAQGEPVEEPDFQEEIAKLEQLAKENRL